MIATCVADAAAAVARGSSATGTMPGSSVVSVVCSNARQAPITNTTASSDSRRHHAERGADRQRRRGEPADQLAGPHDHAPVVAVGDVAGDQHEQGGGEELDQPDQPEVERVAGQVVHLPAHRHRLHLQRDGAGHPGDPIERERPVLAKGRGGRVCRRSWRWFRRLYPAAPRTLRGAAVL